MAKKKSAVKTEEQPAGKKGKAKAKGGTVINQTAPQKAHTTQASTSTPKPIPYVPAARGSDLPASAVGGLEFSLPAMAEVNQGPHLPVSNPKTQLRINPAAKQVVYDVSLLLVVLGHLGEAEVISTRLVCRSWEVAAGTILNLPVPRCLDCLLGILGPTKYDHDQMSSPVFTLNFDFYGISPRKLAAFSRSARTVRKLYLDGTRSRTTNKPIRIAPDVFVAMSVLCKKVSPTQPTFFTNLQELVISEDLFSICPHPFTSMFLPPTTRTLVIHDLGRVSIRTLFGYICTAAPHIESLGISGDAEAIRRYKSFETLDLERVSGIRRLEIRGLTDEWCTLQALSGSCPDLEWLHIEWGSSLEESKIKWRKASFMGIQSLNFSHCSAMQASAMVHFFQNTTFARLTSISISFRSALRTDITHQILHALHSCCKDTLLSLSFSLTGFFSSWEQSHFKSLRRLKNLQYLKLEASGGRLVVDDADFILLCQALPGLKTLMVDADATLLTVDALRICSPDSDYSLAYLSVPIKGYSPSQHSSIMGLPETLQSLCLKVIELTLENVTPLAASVSSACPKDASVLFDGSPSGLISSLHSTFLTLQAWRRNSEERAMAKLRTVEAELKDMKAMYQHIVAERDATISERNIVESVDTASAESTEEL